MLRRIARAWRTKVSEFWLTARKDLPRRRRDPMAESATCELGEAEALAVVYAPRRLRERFRTALALDSHLARIALHAREPALAQIKLAWWRDALGSLQSERQTPLLRDLRAAWGDEFTVLVTLVDAWEEMVAGGGDFAPAANHVAYVRASVMAAAAEMSAGKECRLAARRWTLVTLAPFAPDDRQRSLMHEAARAIPPVRLERSLRPLGVLDGLARRALRRGDVALLGDRLSPLAAIRLGILGR